MKWTRLPNCCHPNMAELLCFLRKATSADFHLMETEANGSCGH